MQLKQIISMFVKYQKLVKNEVNKSAVKIYLDMIYCSIKYGASPANYYKFDFFKDGIYKSSFVTNHVSSKMIKKYNSKEAIDAFEDKISFMETYKDFTKRIYIAYPQCTKQQYEEFRNNNTSFIAKPVNGSQGQGIMVFHNNLDFKSLSKSLGKNRYIIEPFILQHQELNSFYDKAINCVRVITVLKENNVHFLVGNITFGYEYEIANASYGGITCEIDIDTGIIVSDGGQYGHRTYIEHPYSGKVFKGYKIPYWSDVKQLIKNACYITPKIAYVGWDIAITPDGPIIIEGNSSPGYTYFQIPQLLQNGEGVKNCYKEFI